MGRGVCTSCNNIDNLEKCFECDGIICTNCIQIHYNKWKSCKDRECLATEINLKFYREEIDKLNETFVRNEANTKIAETEIEQSYNNMIRILNNEKHELLKSLNEIKKQNEKYTNFKNDIEAINHNLRSFRETNQFSNSGASINVAISKFENNQKMAEKCDQEFMGFRDFPIKFLENFNKTDQSLYHQQYLGRLDFKEARISTDVRSIQPRFSEPRAVSILVGAAAIDLKQPTANNELYSRILLDRNSKIFPTSISEPQSVLPKENLSKWKDKASKAPDEEIEINTEFVPCFITKCRNYIYCMNENGTVLQFIATTKSIDYKNNFNIDVPKVQSISCNRTYFGLTYSKLEIKEMKKMLKDIKSKSAVLLFKTTNDMISTTFDKILENDFKSPTGLVLNDEFAFVCDKELQKIFKINISNGQIVNKIQLSNGEPYDCSINKNYLIITDPYNHMLCLYDINTFENIKNLKIDQDDLKSGPFNVYINENNHIFYKNNKDAHLLVTDTNFDEQIYFKHLISPFKSFTLLELPKQVLIIGAPSKKKFKFITYNY